MKNVVRRSWDVIPITDTVIAQVNALSQGQHNDLDLLDQNKHPIGKLNITWVDYGETEAPHIDLIEPETDIDPISATEAPHIELIESETGIDPISAGTETLLEIVELQDISTIYLEQEMGIEIEDKTTEDVEQRIDPGVI